ncbi:MAG TPA: 2-phosphosulfolactate phosphatase [Longimicrobiales bacterium]|nr:2-phosphosulfolactate phosphatase [Longimicrobiales bacterium]
MRLDVAFTPGEVRNAGQRPMVVVIDVLRATSTITNALANGARSVLPVGTVEDAARTAERIGRDAVVLCGERGCEPIRGFQLGNSPSEFTADQVAGKTLVMTTTNGTPALLAAHGAQRVYVASLLNVSAVAARIAAETEETLIICAGREGAFAMEDALCAGLMIRLVRKVTGRVGGNDAALASVRLARSSVTPGQLARTAAGRRLHELGLGQDVKFCAQQDLHEVVPVLGEHRITL